VIVGSYFKEAGRGDNLVDEGRVSEFVRRFAELRT
jgi:predicted TIM-barrel enzyme